MLRFLRWQAAWIDRHLGGKEQMMLGAFCVDVAIPLHVYGLWFLSQPVEFFIYEMSAFAILATGFAFIAAGQALLEVEKTEDA